MSESKMEFEQSTDTLEKYVNITGDIKTLNLNTLITNAINSKISHKFLTEAYKIIGKLSDDVQKKEKTIQDEMAINRNTRDTQITTLQNQKREKQVENEALSVEIGKKNEELYAKNNLINEKENLIVSLTEDIKKKDSYIYSLEDVNKKKDLDINTFKVQNRDLMKQNDTNNTLIATLKTCIGSFLTIDSRVAQILEGGNFNDFENIQKELDTCTTALTIQTQTNYPQQGMEIGNNKTEIQSYEDATESDSKTKPSPRPKSRSRSRSPRK